MYIKQLEVAVNNEDDGLMTSANGLVWQSTTQQELAEDRVQWGGLL